MHIVDGLSRGSAEVTIGYATELRVGSDFVIGRLAFMGLTLTQARQRCLGLTNDDRLNGGL
jgi:ribosomal protein L13E